MWVLGIVVGALKLFDKVDISLSFIVGIPLRGLFFLQITGGVGYDVRYTLSGESKTSTFPQDAIRQPQQY